jgi:thiamine-monophosphate kinase
MLSVETLLRHKVNYQHHQLAKRMKTNVYRNGAKQTDLLVVTGDIGAAYMGLQVLEREKASFQVNPNSQPDAYTYLIERQLKPEVRSLLHALK